MAHYVITGASSGIGAALAVELGRRGHAVGLIARRVDQLEQVAEAVRAAGGRASHATADVTDRDAVYAAVALLTESLGPVDCMIANAGGGGGPTTARRINPDAIARAMRLNFDGAVNAFAAVLPSMVERGEGHIAVVSSIAALRGVPPAGAYSASKAAIATLMEAWAVELRGSRVTVTTITPGFVKTPLTDANNFAMPMLMPVDRAARIIANGLERRRRHIAFPRTMFLGMRLIQALPAFVFEALAGLAVPSAETMKKR